MSAYHDIKNARLKIESKKVEIVRLRSEISQIITDSQYKQFEVIDRMLESLASSLHDLEDDIS